MAKYVDCLIFYPTTITIKNPPIAYVCLYLFSLHFSCPTNHHNQLRYTHTRFNIQPTVPSLLYTLSVHKF
jgi:hypothetical protein